MNKELHIGVKIQHLRKRRELTQKELAKQVSFFEIPRLRLIALVFQKRGFEFTEKFSRRFSIFMLKMANSGSVVARDVKKRSEQLHFVPKLSTTYLKKLKKTKKKGKLSSEELRYIELIKKDPSNPESYRKLGDYQVDVFSDKVYAKKVKDYIFENLIISCPNGEYPHINISGYLVEDDTVNTCNDNVGSVCLDGYVWIYCERLIC